MRTIYWRIIKLKQSNNQISIELAMEKNVISNEDWNTTIKLTLR